MAKAVASKPAEHETVADGHDAEAVTAEMADKLATRSRHVALLVGAGASMSVGLPGLERLSGEALRALEGPQAEQAAAVMRDRNLEQALTRLRRLAAVLEGEESLAGLDRASAEQTERALSAAVVQALNSYEVETGPFADLAAWAAGGYYSRPIELFTLNYDLMLERAFEGLGVPYFDGFVGTLRADFRPDLVENQSPQSGGLPTEFVRLWKLHGSVNWTRTTGGTPQRIVRLGTPATGQEVAVIYPSEVKYEESRRVPFVVLFDRFRRSLSDAETLVLTTGYSFRDEHVNELVLDASPRNKRSEYVVFVHGEVAGDLADAATRLPNLTVLAPLEAVIGGKRAPWIEHDDIPGIWGGGRFLLGEFSYLTRFLARTVRPESPLGGGGTGV